MLRLTTPAGVRIEDARQFDVCHGGAEANVAVQLAQFGRSTEFVTRLPENELGAGCVEQLRARAVGTQFITRAAGRIGLYFIEHGAGVRPASVLYDRANSAFAGITPGMFDWDAIFAGAKWFHWSGITPALGGRCAEVCREACEAAKRRGLIVSFDINFRGKLWSATRAAEVLSPLMQLVDVCVCGEDEAVSILGAATMEEEDAARLPAVAASLAKRHGFKTVAMTSRGGSAGMPAFRAMLHTGAGPHFSRTYELAAVDRIGTGDAFTAGLIFALLRGSEPGAAIEFAAAASVWKHTIAGDWNRAGVAEIEAVAGGNVSGHVRR